MAGIVLALLSAFAHAGWNFITKRRADGGLTAMWTYWLSSLVMLAIALPTLSHTTRLNVTFSADAGWAALVSSIFHAVYFATLTWAYRNHDVSVAYPLSRGIAPVIVAVLAAGFLGRMPAPLAWVRLIGMGIAVWLLGSQPKNWPKKSPKEADSSPSHPPSQGHHATTTQLRVRTQGSQY